MAMEQPGKLYLPFRELLYVSSYRYGIFHFIEDSDESKQSHCQWDFSSFRAEDS